VVDVDAVLPLVAEALGQFQQLLGHPAGHVGEDQVGHHVVGPTQSTGELPEESAGDLWSSGQPVHQLVVFEGPDLTGGDRRRRGGPGARIEERELAEHLARPQDGEQVLPTGRSAPTELDLSADHDVEPVLGIALVEQDLTLVELDRPHGRRECGCSLVLEPSKQRSSFQDFRIHARPPGSDRQHSSRLPSIRPEM
jgi:hypothetical protein